MADWTKSESADAITHDEVAHPSTVDGGAISCVDDDAIYLILRWAPIEAVANTNPGYFLVMGSDKTTGDENWAVLAKIGTPVVTAATANVDTSEDIGATVIGVSATASLVTESWCYLQDTTTDTDSEWCYILTVATDDTITILDGITVAKDTSDDSWSDAQVVGLPVDVHAFNRFKVVWVNQGDAAANSAIWVTYSKATDHG